MKNRLRAVAILTILMFIAGSIGVTNAATYTYDQLNRLILVDYGNGQMINYTYDVAGNILNIESNLSFEISSTVPLNEASGVPVEDNIAITFTKDIQEGPCFDLITLQSTTSITEYVYSINDSQLIIDPINDLDFNTTYTVNLPYGAVASMDGTVQNHAYSFQFTTVGSADRTEPVTVTPPGGRYDEPQTVSMAVYENTRIYYTLDGTDPTLESMLYTEPLSIESTTTLKYFTVNEEGGQSRVYTEEYIINNGDNLGEDSVETGIDEAEVKHYAVGLLRLTK